MQPKIGSPLERKKNTRFVHSNSIATYFSIVPHTIHSTQIEGTTVTANKENYPNVRLINALTKKQWTIHHLLECPTYALNIKATCGDTCCVTDNRRRKALEVTQQKATIECTRTFPHWLRMAAMLFTAEKF